MGERARCVWMYNYFVCVCCVCVCCVCVCFMYVGASAAAFCLWSTMTKLFLSTHVNYSIWLCVCIMYVRVRVCMCACSWRACFVYVRTCVGVRSWLSITVIGKVTKTMVLSWHAGVHSCVCAVFRAFFCIYIYAFSHCFFSEFVTEKNEVEISIPISIASVHTFCLLLLFSTF